MAAASRLLDWSRRGSLVDHPLCPARPGLSLRHPAASRPHNLTRRLGEDSGVADGRVEFVRGFQMIHEPILPYPPTRLTRPPRAHAPEVPGVVLESKPLFATAPLRDRRSDLTRPSSQTVFTVSSLHTGRISRSEPAA